MQTKLMLYSTTFLGNERLQR